MENGVMISDVSAPSPSIDHDWLNTPFKLGDLLLPNRLIQGPLAGYSCAPFRELFSLFMPPAFCVSEMLSAHDVVHKHALKSRYLYRSPDETRLCYQIAGNDSGLMAEAAHRLELAKASIIDINCGCPKAKIRKKGAGSALLEDLTRLVSIVSAVRLAIRCPLTVKIRVQLNQNDITLAQAIADAGADALIIHGRRWTDDYDVRSDLQQIARIKEAVSIPVIANGDIHDAQSLKEAISETACDAFMISRASTGKPWLFQELLTNQPLPIDLLQKIAIFMKHLQGLQALEGTHKAILQSKSLVRYYFKQHVNPSFLEEFYTLTSLDAIEMALKYRAVPA
jgi:nifR3 family TIM-barrel protein